MSQASEDNRAFYNRAAPGRDDYWRKMAAPRARVAMFLDLLQQEAAQRIVDLGCGGGQLLMEISAKKPAADLWGIDLSDQQIKKNQAQWPGPQWATADLDQAGVLAQHLPNLLGTFDVAMASEIIEHVEHPLNFLRNAHALLRPGGRLLLSTQSGPLRETERRVGHRRHFTVSELSDDLRIAGFSPQKVWNCGFPFHDLSKWYANRKPDATMTRFADRPYGLREDLVCFLLRGAFRLNSKRHGAQLFAVARA